MLNRFILLAVILCCHFVDAQITAKIYLSVNKDSICDGEQLTFTAFPSGQTCDLYVVGTTAALQTNSTSAPFTRTPTGGAGTRTYYIKIFDGASWYQSNNVVVKVNPKPGIGSQNGTGTSFTTSDPSISLATFIDLPTGGAGDVGLNIEFTGNATINNYFYPVIGPGNYSPNYTITNSFGCKSGPTAFTSALQVTSSPGNIPTIFNTSQSSYIPFCEGSTANTLQISCNR